MIISQDVAKLTAILAAVFIGIATLWYVQLILRGKVRPTIASWIIITGTMWLSFGTYWFANPNHSLLGNVGNSVCCLSVTMNLIAIIIRNIWKKKILFSFSNFQKLCLLMAFIIAISWGVIMYIGGSGFIPNILTQFLMIVGYAPTVVKLWKKSEESFIFWFLLFVGCFLSFGPAIENAQKDVLPLFYSGRASLTTAITAWLVVRKIFVHTPQ